MTNENDTINVIVHPVSGECEYGGLTKREYFSAMANPNIEGWSESVAEEAIGYPPSDKLGRMKWTCDFKATLKVMEADTLIKALNKNQ